MMWSYDDEGDAASCPGSLNDGEQDLDPSSAYNGEQEILSSAGPARTADSLGSTSATTYYHIPVIDESDVSEGSRSVVSDVNGWEGSQGSTCVQEDATDQIPDSLYTPTKKKSLSPRKKSYQTPKLIRKTLPKSMGKPLYQPWKSISRPPLSPRPLRPTKPVSFQVKPIKSMRNIQIPLQQRIQLAQSIKYLSTPLAPLISVTTGLAHPQFPASILAFHVLTHDQIDSLVEWYHQTQDAGPEHWMYPKPIINAWIPNDRAAIENDNIVDLATKRRRFGRFIGLNGRGFYQIGSHREPFSHRALELSQHNLKTRTHAGSNAMSISDTESDGAASTGVERKDEKNVDNDTAAFTANDLEHEEETVTQKMDREWRAAMQKAEEERKIQEKVWRGYW